MTGGRCGVDTPARLLTWLRRGCRSSSLHRHISPCRGALDFLGECRRVPYDLTDREWKYVTPLIPLRDPGPEAQNRRDVISNTSSIGFYVALALQYAPTARFLQQVSAPLRQAEADFELKSAPLWYRDQSRARLIYRRRKCSSARLTR